MRAIEGGVCAAKGFTANGVHCGIRKSQTKKDLSLIFSEVPASAAAVYTTNLVKGAPLTVTKRHLANGTAQAGKDTLELIVAGNDEQFTVTALFDNLGKGASGAAIQNMNILLGVDEATGLNLG